MAESNILLMTDSYKVTHWKQYPKGTQRVFSFLESRGGQGPTTTFFGLAYIIAKYLKGAVVTQEKIEEAASYFEGHFGSAGLFNREGWEYIVRKHGGFLPVEIKAVPEGTTVDNHNVLLTIENTDPNVPWLVNYLETLLVQVWYPTTVCTQSRSMKLAILRAMRATGADIGGAAFKLHDFGYRGSTSVESAGLGGAAHLVNFLGTDTLAALQVVREYYGLQTPAGFSIPAAEHSTITSWGKDGERAAYENMLEQYPTGLVAVVSDSYDIFNAVSKIWGEDLKDKVLQRDGVVVIRPDSGHPLTVIMRLLETLWSKFGGTTNEAGFKVLHPKVRLIQGDGIDAFTLNAILDEMVWRGWSIDNIAFGSGGGLLQKVNRDTYRFAMKCSAIQIDDEWHDVMKNPVSDPLKKSKPGKLILCRDDKGVYSTRVEGEGENVLRTVFRNGTHMLHEDEFFPGIRARAAEGV